LVFPLAFALAMQLALLVAGADIAWSREDPRWELGLGLLALDIPDYRGSDERLSFVLPLPYVRYRGERFRLDREGGHLDLLRSNRVELDFSVSGGLPVDSDDNEARRDMPDLDPSLEFGPQLNILLSQAQDTRWRLVLPLRKVIATDLRSLDSIGWVFAPLIDVNYKGQWNTTLALGPLFATEDYHDYFYQVSPDFVRPERPAFDAEAGYSGSRLTLRTGRRYRRIWVSAFARYDDLSGAAFEDSPLRKQSQSLMLGIFVAWILGESHPSP
jgi:outer membrane scaffolding protein for murein synthesis (MipA/OmpV family)